jgi:hypothetical protein
MIPLRAGTILRAGGALLLAGATLAVFLLGRREDPPSPPATPVPVSRTVSLLDSGVDSVLARFGIDPAAAAKRRAGIPGERFSRTERVAVLPDSVAPVSVNASLNSMARALGARAVASEDPRLRTVTVHIDLGGVVVHTVILKPSPGRAARAGRAGPAT